MQTFLILTHSPIIRYFPHFIVLLWYMVYACYTWRIIDFLCPDDAADLFRVYFAI